MSRLQPKFDMWRESARKALIPFLTAGDPTPEFTVPMMHAMVKAGVDIIELGVPFSDPMADGPVIQRASERALAKGMNLSKVLDMVREFRSVDTETPVVLMGYLNPIECMGYKTFVSRAQSVGVDGILTVDMPPEEAGELIRLFDDAEIDPIFLLAPNSTQERIEKVSAVGRGFIYYVSLKGVTGASNLDLADVNRKTEQISRTTNLPVAVGFGVNSPETAAAIGKLADAVVIGSALIKLIESDLDGSVDALREKITGTLMLMRTAMDS